MLPGQGEGHLFVFTGNIIFREVISQRYLILENSLHALRNEKQIFYYSWREKEHIDIGMFVVLIYICSFLNLTQFVKHFTLKNRIKIEINFNRYYLLRFIVAKINS